MKVRTKVGGNFFLAALVLIAALAPACARTQAQVSPDVPALDVPVPPSRVISTGTLEAPPAVGTPSAGLPSGVEELSRRDPPKPQPGVAARPTTAKPAEPAKSDAPIDLPKPPDEPRATSPLQTTPPKQEADVEAAIRADMNRAKNNLDRVDYQKLTPDAKLQYDLAKSYILQAEDGIRAKNLPYARSLAEKAVAIAAQLSGR